MKKNWTYKKLGELVNIRTGKLDANAADENGKYPFFTCSREPLRINTYSYDCECILVAGNGELNVKYYNGKFDAYQRTYIIEKKPEVSFISTYYIYQFFRSYIEELRKRSIGGIIKYIKLGDLTGAQIPLPPLSEQQSIVRELDLLNDLIAKKRAQVAEYDQLQQSLFYTMFGDPVTNEKGWEVKKLGEVAEFYNGKAHEQFIDEQGSYILINSKFIASDASLYKKTNRQICPLYKNDIVMVMSDVPNGRALAKCYLITQNDKYSLNQRICAFRNYRQNPTYLIHTINRNAYYLEFDNGNSQTNLRKEDVLACPIPLPPLSLQQEFARKVEAIEALKAKVNDSIREAETLLASRMDYYFG